MLRHNVVTPPSEPPFLPWSDRGRPLVSKGWDPFKRFSWDVGAAGSSYRAADGMFDEVAESDSDFDEECEGTGRSWWIL